jgi:hypothetical protein
LTRMLLRELLASPATRHGHRVGGEEERPG